MKSEEVLHGGKTKGQEMHSCLKTSVSKINKYNTETNKKAKLEHKASHWGKATRQRLLFSGVQGKTVHNLADNCTGLELPKLSRLIIPTTLGVGVAIVKILNSQ